MMMGTRGGSVLLDAKVPDAQQSGKEGVSIAGRVDPRAVI